MDVIWKALMALSTGIALACVGCLLALAALTGVDVVGRYVFNQPIPGFTNAAGLVTALVVAGFLPVLTMSKGNIAVRPFAAIGGKNVARFFDSFAGLLTTAFFGAMTWQYANYAAEAVRSGEYLAVLRWPVGPWWWGVTTIIAVTAVAAFVVFLQETQGHARPDES